MDRASGYVQTNLHEHKRIPHFCLRKLVTLSSFVYVTIGLATSFIYSFTVISLSLYSSLIFQFLSFFQGTAHRVTELLASRLGRDKVILNHPVASIKQVTIKVTVTVLGRHDLLLLMS